MTDDMIQEFVLGLYEGFGSLIRHPYLGATNEGPLGFPKGIGRGICGFGCHTMAGEYTYCIDTNRSLSLLHRFYEALISFFASNFRVTGILVERH